MKNVFHFLVFILFALLFTSCIGDDIVDDKVSEDLRITNVIDSIGFGMTYQFEIRYLDNVGERQNVDVEWSSSDANIVNVSNEGLANGLQSGAVMITAEYQGIDDYLIHEIEVAVGENTTEVEANSKQGTIVTTSSYLLEGDFTVQEVDGDLIVEIADNFRASTALPGLFVYLSNNANSVGGALEISAVTTFNGAHTYTIPNVGIEDYKYLLYFCKPFNIKVGDGDF